MAGSVSRRVCVTWRQVIAGAMTVVFAACGGGGGDTGGSAVNAPPAVGSVIVTAPTAPLQVGAQQTAVAEVRSTTGAVLTGRAVSWSSSNTAVATVSDAGVIAGVTPGTATISATSEGKVGSVSVTVVPAPVSAVVVSAPATTLVAERTLQASVVLRDERGATLTGRTVTWSSSAPAVATVSDAGLVTGVSAGSTTITATSEGKSGTLVLTVVLPPVNSVTIALAQSTVPQGGTTTATVQLRDDRNVLLTGRAITFTSSDAAVATVSSAGVVTALAVGSTTITATSEGKNATALLTVIQPPVASVSVVLPQNSVLPGATVQMQVVLRDASGRTLTGRAVTYVSSNSAVASVNGTGLVTAIAPGTAIVSATSEGQTGQSALQVIVPVASVVVNGSTRVKVGDSYSYTATAKAADGTIVDRPVTWRVRETSRAQMTPSGNLVPLQSGTFTIVAQIDGVDWDASYTAYDWESFSSGGSTFEALDADARVSNRFGTLDYPELVVVCSNTGSFFLWVSTPHIITQNAMVAFSFDNGAPVGQIWSELSPEYRTLYKTGGNAATKSLAMQIAGARRFGFAWGEFLSNATKTAQFRVTGFTPRLANLIGLCPASLVAPSRGSASSAATDEAALMTQFLAARARARGASAGVTPSADALAKAQSGPSAATSRLLQAWPTWTVPEATVARRVKR